MQFDDIKDFYLDITKSILPKDLEFYRGFIPISDKDINVIVLVNKSLLFYCCSLWLKFNVQVLFEVAMGLYAVTEDWKLIQL